MRGRDIAGGDGKAFGAGGGDGEVDIGKRGGTVLKVHHAGAHPGLFCVAGKALGALAGAVGNHQLADAQPARVGGRKRGHRPGAEHQRGLALQILRIEALQCLVKGEGHHRDAGLVDLRFRVHALACTQRGLRQGVDARANRALLGGGLVGRTHLADDLLLAHHHRIQAGGNGHEVFRGGIGIAHVEVIAQLFLIDLGDFLKHPDDVLHAGVEGIGHRIDLEAVARGNDHRLSQGLGINQLPAGGMLHHIVHAQLFQQRHGCRLVGHSHNKHAHAPHSSTF